MTQSKTYKSKIAARFGILWSRIKNKFNGSKLVVETYTMKYNTATKECTVDMNFMTEAEEQQFHIAIAEQQARIAELIMNEAPTMERQKTKEEKWAEDVERNRQKQLAENKSKKAPAKPKTKKPVELTNEAADKIVTDIKNRGVYNGEPTMKAKPKRKYNKGNNTNNKA